MDRKIYGKEIGLESDERESGERNSFSKPSRPRRRRRVYLNSLFTLKNVQVACCLMQWTYCKIKRLRGLSEVIIALCL